MNSITSLRGSSNLNALCDALGRLTYAEMVKFSEKVAEGLCAPEGRGAIGTTLVSKTLSQVAVDGFGLDEVAKHEKAELLKLFKRKRQITVSTVAGGAYQVTVPSMGNVAVVHKDLKQALSQTVDTIVALEAMRK